MLIFSQLWVALDMSIGTVSHSIDHERVGGETKGEAGLTSCPFSPVFLMFGFAFDKVCSRYKKMDVIDFVPRYHL